MKVKTRYANPAIGHPIIAVEALRGSHVVGNGEHDELVEWRA
jgi:hypothetical protein